MSEIKERPILFSAPMVRAILEGRKTVTRRPVKGIALEWLRPDGFTPEFTADPRNQLCPYGQPGDRLWVRETTEIDEQTSDGVVLSRYSADGEPVLYSDSDDPEYDGTVAHWDYPRRSRPSIHMPRWACRILLEITAVRVERLQDISDAQIGAEGIDLDALADGQDRYDMCHAGSGAEGRPTLQTAWRHLWQSVNGLESWTTNPWVWVVEFKRVTP